MKNKSSAIAIIGMSCRFPGSNNPDEYWNNLYKGKDCISLLNNQQLIEHGIDDSVLMDDSYIKAKGVLDKADYFDPALFNMSPYEALAMDPQNRQFLECSYEVLHTTGYINKVNECRIGVVGGSSSISSYYYQYVLTNEKIKTKLDPFQLSILNTNNFLTTYVSYKLNLTGPSFTVQTGCSTALTAIAVARQQLLMEQCDLCVAGGVCVSLPLLSGYIYKKNSIMSPDGHCRPFSNNANGTVPGDGIGIVLLKRLEDAVNDKDPIIAIIEGVGFNNDGSKKVGFSAPGVIGQSTALNQAYKEAKIEPSDVGFIETHGTGTALGDPVEFQALEEVFHASKQCYLGAVKSNIGHLDAAAGVAGLVKAALCLYHRQIPPTLYFDQPNPYIDFESSPFQINSQPIYWHQGNSARYAGVSSLGIGGTNVHIVLSEAPAELRYNKDTFKRNFPFQKNQYMLANNSSISTLPKEDKGELKNKVITHEYHNIESFIKEMWEDCLGYDEIELDIPFIDLGGDSISGINIIEEINQRYKTKLSAHDLITSHTVHDLSKLIYQSINNRPLDKSDNEFFSLIKLNTGNPAIKPLFLFHAIGGTVNYYQYLVQFLPKELPVYGLQSASLESSNKEQASLKEMAASYIPVIKSVQPVGPYRLAGHSFGGLLSYEIACQLQYNGESIDFIAMMDTPGFEHMPRELSDNADILENMALVLNPQAMITARHLKELSLDDQINYFLAHIDHDEFKALKPDTMKVYLDTFKINTNAMFDYQPKPLKTVPDVLFFKALERDEFTPESPELGWIEHIGAERVSVYEISGGHHTMMYPIHVKTIAKTLTSIISDRS
jgi:3-oxoacyl-(acyl-carrier-protein) synthase/thioesterase domain-containing protein/acyl carrier protein